MIDPSSKSEDKCDQKNRASNHVEHTITTLSEGRLKLLADSTFEGICILEHGFVMDANEQFCNLFGYPLDELRGMSWFELIDPTSHDTVKKYFVSGYHGPYEMLSRRRDGSVFPTEMRAKNFYYRHEKVRLILIRDLTSQRKLKREIEENERRYRELYHHSPVALYRARISDGELLECNHAFLKLFGYDCDSDIQFISKATDRYVNIEDRYRLLSMLEKQRQIDSFQVQVKQKKGEIIWVQVSVRAYPEKDFKEAAMQDITASKILTPAEKQVVRLVAEGKSSKQIAYMLHRSPRTIEEHRYRCMKKLNVSNLAELIQKSRTLDPERFDE